MERTIKRKDLMRLVELCKSYDPWPMMIDSYDEQKRVERKNKSVVEELTSIVNKYTGSNKTHYPIVDMSNYPGSDELVAKRLIEYLGEVYNEVHSDEK